MTTLFRFPWQNPWNIPWNRSIFLILVVGTLTKYLLSLNNPSLNLTLLFFPYRVRLLAFCMTPGDVLIRHQWKPIAWQPLCVTATLLPHATRQGQLEQSRWARWEIAGRNVIQIQGTPHKASHCFLIYHS